MLAPACDQANNSSFVEKKTIEIYLCLTWRIRWYCLKVRAASISALSHFAARVPSIRTSLCVLLSRSMLDEDDEVGTPHAVDRNWTDLITSVTYHTKRHTSCLLFGLIFGPRGYSFSIWFVWRLLLALCYPSIFIGSTVGVLLSIEIFWESSLSVGHNCSSYFHFLTPLKRATELNRNWAILHVDFFGSFYAAAKS